MALTIYQQFLAWNSGRRKSPEPDYLVDDFLTWVRYECLKAIPFHLCPPETHYKKALAVLDAIEHGKTKGEKTEEQEERLQAAETIREKINFRVKIMGYKI